MQTNNSFWMVFEVPLKTPEDSKCALRSLSNFPAKFRSPQKTPGLAESDVSSCPRNGNSKLPQNLMQSIILDKICQFPTINALNFTTHSFYTQTLRKYCHVITEVCFNCVI